MFRFRPAASGLILILAVALFGCGDPQAKTNYSRARVVNALVGVPNGGNIDVASSHNYATATNVPFGGVTSYVAGSLGETNITATEAGTNTVVLPSTQTFLATQQSDTIAVAGVVGGTGALAPRVFNFTDTAPPTNFGSTNLASINFAIKFYNLSPDSPALNLQGAGSPTGLAPPPLTSTGVVPGLTNVSYGNASDYVIISVPAGRDAKGNAEPFAWVTLTINSTATGALLNAPTLTTLTSVTNGEIFTVFVTGLVHPGAGQQSLDANVTPGVF